MHLYHRQHFGVSIQIYLRLHARRVLCARRNGKAIVQGTRATCLIFASLCSGEDSLETTLLLKPQRLLSTVSVLFIHLASSDVTRNFAS